MTEKQIETERASWLQPLMEWSSVEMARARLSGSADHVPRRVGDIELSNIGHQLYAWWLEARGERAMPEAGDVGPASLAQLLPYIRYLSWEGDEELVFRIYGSALAEATGLDLTGYNVFGSNDPEERVRDIARLRVLHEQPCGVVMIRDVFAKDGKTYPCELMTLPIAGGADGKQRIIGTLVPCERMNEWNVKVAADKSLALRRAVFIDTGFGVPDPSRGLGR